MNLISCGPSAAEIAAREKIKSDSIALAVQQQLLQEQAEAERQANLKQQLIDLKAQLAGEEAKLGSIQDFQILRTKDEKAEQVANQTRIIEEIKGQIEEVEKEIKE